MYPGRSTITASPGSTRQRASRSSPCCAPPRIRTLSAGTPKRSAIASRSAGCPSVGPCRQIACLRASSRDRAPAGTLRRESSRSPARPRRARDRAHPTSDGSCRAGSNRSIAAPPPKSCRATRTARRLDRVPRTRTCPGRRSRAASPRDSSSRYAATTVVRLMLRRCANSRSGGTRPPDGISPREMAVSRRLTRCA